MQKTNVLKALEQIDDGKYTLKTIVDTSIDHKGTVRVRVLLNLLDCMDFKLSNEDIEKIKGPAFTTNEISRYREVLTALVFNKDQRQWTVRTDIINYAEIVS